MKRLTRNTAYCNIFVYVAGNGLVYVAYPCTNFKIKQ